MHCSTSEDDAPDARSTATWMQVVPSGSTGTRMVRSSVRCVCGDAFDGGKVNILYE